MNRSFLAALCLLAAPVLAAPAFIAAALAAEVHYAPRENLEAIDVALLDGAQRKIDIAVYGFSSAPVMNALAEAALRGVHVRIYRDRTQTHVSPELAEFLAILLDTPNVEIRFKRAGPIMHLKAYAVDGVVLRTGSANFTKSSNAQDNDLVIDRDAADVRAFEADFNAMWER